MIWENHSLKEKMLARTRCLGTKEIRIILHLGFGSDILFSNHYCSPRFSLAQELNLQRKHFLAISSSYVTRIPAAWKHAVSLRICGCLECRRQTREDSAVRPSWLQGSSKTLPASGIASVCAAGTMRQLRVELQSNQYPQRCGSQPSLWSKRRYYRLACEFLSLKGTLPEGLLDVWSEFLILALSLSFVSKTWKCYGLPVNYLWLLFSLKSQAHGVHTYGGGLT